MFLVSLVNPVRGSYFLGYIDSQNIREAQSILVQKLVKSGIPLHKISQEVAGHSLVSIGPSIFNIVPFNNIKELETLNLAALL
jgi:hypothetical protein